MSARVPAAFRAVRIRRGWRQEDVARRAGVSRGAVSMVERGHIDGLTLGLLLRIAAALEIRLDVVPRWRGGDLDRLLDARHAALGEHVATYLAGVPGWALAPEVSFAIWAERGRVDILAWHPVTRSLLVVELKTEIVDVQEMLGTLDAKRRLAKKIAAERGWYPTSVSVWLVVAGSRTNRRRVAAHRTLLGAAFPDRPRALRTWLTEPIRTVAAMSFWPTATGSSASQGIAPIRRVRRPSPVGRERARTP